MRVGPSATDYKGELEIVRLDSTNHEIEMIGKGQDVSGRGSASMKMTAKATSLQDGGTEVTSLAEVNVVGILAQMGSRMINEVSNILFAQFIKNFQAQLEQPAEQPRPKPSRSALHRSHGLQPKERFITTPEAGDPAEHRTQRSCQLRQAMRAMTSSRIRMP